MHLPEAQFAQVAELRGTAVGAVGGCGGGPVAVCAAGARGPGVRPAGGLDLRPGGAGHRDEIIVSLRPYVAVVGVRGCGEGDAERDEPG